MSLASSLAKSGIFGEFRDELAKLSASYFWLLLAQGRHRQQNLRKRPQVAAVIGGDLELLDPCFLVAVDSSEAEEKPLDSRQTSDDVIRRAQAKIGISGVRGDCNSFLAYRSASRIFFRLSSCCLSMRLA